MNGHSAVERIEGPPSSSGSIKKALLQKIHVMHAVIMRDIRSRFFNHGLGFLIVPLFPVTHMAILLGIYSVMNRQSAFGDDLRLFFATGLMPALTFTYLSRFMSISLMANKSMMAFPVVRLLDIVLARAFLEFIGIVLAVLIMLIFLVSVGSNPIPRDPSGALLAFFFTVVLALGFGIIASVISAIAPVFATLYGFSMVLFYLSSGAPIYLHAFPEQVLYICSWNPVFHSVEWIRTSYYLGYPDQFLDKTYLIGYSILSVTVGLLMERIFRSQVLAN
ncbi:MAG: ABC transporter permease [Drouetiella hepatica Uher 2000/2452]|jgi:capsular polysaccharide transport system permease protein|uniref:ABC transporter permease n=1 Tax=Drouetiella hepatica Uher 2000/2452 TaxID=904376 RepID=A0A951UPY0_9CYAN|nr:ABC transporter permease [Drouetiella hepatica Uher 2000/2452]